MLNLPVSGQPYDFLNRNSEIERCTKHVYAISEFRQVADSLQLSIDELSDYPVICPIKNPQRILSTFGIRYHPIYKMLLFHTGIDIPGIKDTPVYATGNGVIIRKGYDSGFGNFIEIEHAGGFRSFYAHLSKTMVNIGDSVSIMQQIGYVGDTGITTGNHLHYEVRKGKGFLNPAGWCGFLSLILNGL